MKPITAHTLRVLRSRGADGLTDLEAMSADCGRRLAARIGELKAAGHRIEGVWERSESGRTRFKRYYLVEPRPVPTTGQQLPLMEGAR